MGSKMFALVFAILSVLAVKSVDGCGECVCASGSYDGYGPTEEAATAAASSNCGFTRECDAAKGCSCKLMMSDCLSSVDCRSDSGRSGSSRRYKCTARCSGASRSCLHGPVPPPGGEGDPHMTGFDGTHFAFHGEHGHNYLLFGRKGGDSLVTTMRATNSKMMREGAKYLRTYFDEFSVQTADNDQITVTLGREGCVAPRVWCPQVVVNGKLTGAFIGDKVRVNIAKDTLAVSVETKDSTFSIIPKRMTDDEKHLDVHVKLNRVPTHFDRFTGVLGVTLNRRLGRVVHSRFAARRDPVALEMELRKSFEVTEKFPAKEDAALSIDGVMRIPYTHKLQSECNLIAFAIA